MINKSEFTSRRKKLFSKLNTKSIAIIHSNKLGMTFNKANHFNYLINKYFYYLTGINKLDAIAVFIKTKNTKKYILFYKNNDPIWQGNTISKKNILKKYNLDEAFDIEVFNKLLPKLISNKQNLYCDINKECKLYKKIIRSIKGKKTLKKRNIDPLKIIQIKNIIDEMRLYKSKSEIKLLQKAADITANGIIRAMKICKAEMLEYELEAEILYTFNKLGHKEAFKTIIGSGNNACILHYKDNNSKLKNGKLVLIDTGVEYHSYSSDISRTFPINGNFTNEQKAIYQAVLDTQSAVISKIKPGITWLKLQKISEQIITKKLLELGILKGEISDLLKNKAYEQFYMHSIGHSIGLDTHDELDKNKYPLSPNITVTIEPGIYIANNTKNVHKKWWGIGVRIEDIILVTKNGYKILTKKAPKTIAEIENLLT